MPYTPVLDLGYEGSRLKIAFEPDEDEPDWFRARFMVEAYPWGGVVEATLTRDDLLAFAQDLRTARLPRKLVLGGGRAAELILDLSVQLGQNHGRIAMVAELAQSGDDPYPFIRWLIYNVSPDFGPVEAGAIEALVRSSAPPST